MMKDLIVSAALIMGVIAWISWDVDTCTRYELREVPDRNDSGERTVRLQMTCVERAQ